MIVVLQGSQPMTCHRLIRLTVTQLHKMALTIGLFLEMVILTMLLQILLLANSRVIGFLLS